MAVQQTTQTIEKFLSAFNLHNADEVASCYSADVVIHDPLIGRPLNGREALRQDTEDFFTSSSDVQVKNIRMTTGDDRVAVEMDMIGTQNGPMSTPAGAVPATNKKYDLRVAYIMQLNGQGLISEERRYFDVATVMRQLGLV